MLSGLQTSAPSKDVAFEVASIRPAKPGSRGYTVQPLPNGLHVANTPVRTMVAEAYHVYDFQVSGGPKWIDEDRYDIEAKAASGPPLTRGQLRDMFQKLLADRFRVELHRESKTLPVYVLEAAKNGVKVKKSEEEGDPYFRVFQRRQITAQRAPLSFLTEALSVLMGRPVIDKTGLEGNFDYKLEWTPDATQVRSSDQPVGDDDNVPGLTSSIQEQLGLRLLSQKAPVEIVVIDRAEKPSEN